MTTSADPVARALQAAGELAAGLSWSGQPRAVHEATERVLGDSLGVMVAGAELPEMARLRAVLPRGEGPATRLGDERTVSVTDAAWGNGTSLVALELDEGNKEVRGHSTAHVLPAALALAEAHHATGEQFARAFVAGHEVASRFGRAVVLRPGVHPHGNWGVAGAAAAAALLGGADADEVARAVDIAGALALATPFRTATSGMAVRNAWVGQANVAGIQAAGLARLGEPLAGIAVDSLGGILGSFDPAALGGGPGSELAITRGYFKRHASCSYTHPPADLALELFGEAGPVDPGAVDRIDVSTHRLAAPLAATTWPTRLAAMFSIPYVVAVVLREGRADPAAFDESHRSDPEVRALAACVRVSLDEPLDRQLPTHRAARLRVRWRDGREWARQVGNPVGDTDHLPLSDADLLAKSAALVGRGRADAIWDVARRLPRSPDVAHELAELRGLVTTARPDEPGDLVRQGRASRRA